MSDDETNPHSLSDAEFKATVAADLKYIKRDIKDFRVGQRDLWKVINDLKQEIADMKAKQAEHKGKLWALVTVVSAVVGGVISFVLKLVKV
jgi:hypothetical protein